MSKHWVQPGRQPPRRGLAERPWEPSFTRPPRDTGLMIEGRVARERRLRQRRRRRATRGAIVVTAALLLGGWLVFRATPKQPAPLAVASGAQIMMASDNPAHGASVTLDPTPLFATYKDIAFHLPVLPDKLTEIAFHQASYSYAQHLTSKLPTYPMEKAKDKKGTGRTAAVSVADSKGWLGGYVLRLWRTRPGAPDTAADVGAPAGSPVLAPVDGTVLLVKSYKLYQKYPDYEVHIRPTGHNDLDVVLIHVDKPIVKAGDTTRGGVTQIGSVRNLSSQMNLQLAEYTTAAGDHTHVQINRVEPGTTKGVGS
jgi:murein DD-endopeptidase MepM/ murein hydrolase activator NlpD